MPWRSGVAVLHSNVSARTEKAGTSRSKLVNHLNLDIVESLSRGPAVDGEAGEGMPQFMALLEEEGRAAVGFEREGDVNGPG